MTPAALFSSEKTNNKGQKKLPLTTCHMPSSLSTLIPPIQSSTEGVRTCTLVETLEIFLQLERLKTRFMLSIRIKI